MSTTFGPAGPSTHILPRKEVVKPVKTAKTNTQKFQAEANSPTISRPVPTMGWQAWWYRIGRTLKKDMKPPKLSKKEDKIFNRRMAVKALRDSTLQTTSLKVAFIGASCSGRTTVTALLSSVIADQTRTILCALDCSPAQGDLAVRLGKESETATIRQFASSLENVKSPRDIVVKARPTPYGVRVVGSDAIVKGSGEHLQSDLTDNSISKLSDNTEYVMMDTADVTSTGTLAAVKAADVFVFVANAAVTQSLRNLSSAMETMRHHGFSDKVDRSLVVITGVNDSKSDATSALDKYRHRVNTSGEIEDMLPYAREFSLIPFDPAIRPDGPTELDNLTWDTYQAILKLALRVFDKPLIQPEAS